MNTFILVIWTVVAVSGAPYYERAPHMDWRPVGEFSSKDKCEKAIAAIGRKSELARCLEK